MPTRRKIFAWTMIVVLFTHSFGLNMLYGLYEIDQSFFIELFCVNKDKPELHCNGFCMLSKMNEQSSHEHDKPVLPDINQCQLVYILQYFDLELKFAFNQKKQLYLTHYENFYDFQYLKSIFRPPIIV